MGFFNKKEITQMFLLKRKNLYKSFSISVNNRNYLILTGFSTQKIFSGESGQTPFLDVVMAEQRGRDSQ